MDEIVPWLFAPLGLLLSGLGLQLFVHRDRWRSASTETSGDYRVAPRTTPGVFRMPWPTIGASALAAVWSLATLVFAAAGALLLLVSMGEEPSWFTVVLASTLVSGVAHAALLVRGASRLVRRHERARRSSTTLAIHGVAHHALVLALFLRWTWLEHHHDVEAALSILGPICLLGATISGLVLLAARSEGSPSSAAATTTRWGGGRAASA